ncbi:MAG TPA: carboxypeptidase regulatory-like domain-containing protein [Thermoanaerobaculia bacterium]|nr:carboxypeptidase regulatory-like domain-containing protein [Thermoanaerobaculia bacterium]
MKSTNFWGRALAVAAVLLLVAGGSAFAQLQTGALFGTAIDDQGNVLPGVTVTLTGAAGPPQVQVTDAQGRFRYPTLGPGSYSVKAELEGFSPVDYPNISINIGRNTEIEITMNSAVKEVITVTTESPLLDQRRISAGATIEQTELEKIPTSRDPWAIMQSTPGVLTDRINVGGNESGQQSQYVGPGSSGDQAVWSVDGVTITDMGALGSSPAYYDFDSFEEIQITTGGSDTTVATGGIVLNMVTKRGTNEWRGSGRYYVADNDWQSDLDFDENDLAQAGPWSNDTPQEAFNQGNRIVKVEDYGVELGGPVVKDRFWVWGSFGKQEVGLLTIDDVSDFTELETMNVKLNAQLSQSNSATASGLQSDKIKIGRNASPTRPQPTTWNQSKFGDDPTTWKVEDTHIFSPSFYLTGMYSVVNGGFQLVPQGGMDINATWDEDFVWQNSFLLYQTPRPQEQFKADASTFVNTGSVAHELKYGAGYREADVSSLSRWPGFGIQLNFYQSLGNEDPADDVPYNVIELTRDALPSSHLEYTNFYLQDTLSAGNLTANIGLRYDRQEPTLDRVTVRANPAFPDLLPEATFEGGSGGFSWESITPRLGLTYALGQERKTLLRASYSQFADQLGTGIGTWISPLYPGTYLYLYYDDQNGDGIAQQGEVLANTPCNACSVPYNGTYNPLTRGLLVSNGVDPDLKPPMTHELLFGIDHAVRPEFLIEFKASYRLLTDLLEQERLVFDGDIDYNSIGRLHRADDYVPVTTTTTLPDGRVQESTYYVLRDGVTTRNGFWLENGDREQNFFGASLGFNKRLANRWMLRGNVSWQDWEWDVPNSEREDPTRLLGGGPLGSGSQDGDPVLQGSGSGSGAKGGVYINSNWSYSLTGMYQIAPERPWGFNAALSAYGREGYPNPYFRRVDRGSISDFLARNTSILVAPDQDSYRLDDIHMMDARLEKEFTVSDLGLTLTADVFNVLNQSYVIQRAHRLNRANGDFVREITSPRIFRLGLRISFR